MKKILEFIIAILVIALVLYGLMFFKKAMIFKDIKNKIADIQNITNFYQKQDSDFESIDDNSEIIYKRLGNIIIKEFDNIIIVNYGNKTYSLNKEYKFYMEIESDEIGDYNLTTNDFPVDELNTNTWALVNNVEVKTVNFYGERCYELIYKKDENIYTKYIRKEDGICMGIICEIDGKENKYYYITEINTQKEEEYSFEAIVEGYDKAIVNTYEEPYIIRKDGTIEYIIFED